MQIGPRNPNPQMLYAQRRKPRTIRQVAIGQFLINLAAWTAVGVISLGGIIGVIYLIGLVF